MSVSTLMTAEELLRLPDGERYELVRGELKKMSPSGSRHGRVAAQIAGSLIPHVRRNKLGAVYIADAGFRIGRNPDTVRAPDAAFVRAERVIDTPGFFEGPPDVVFEVV
ncbi:MAG TPA: Uma2 family endonuclease, partial [Thermoanaerobaculia bacterium]|nr:Uma2 family endonuclease [Thermoanaerobaculia bacterium]